MKQYLSNVLCIEFMPIFPPYTSLRMAAISPDHSSAKGASVRRRRRRDTLGFSSYSLSSLLKELAFACYELKSMRISKEPLSSHELKSRESDIGNCELNPLLMILCLLLSVLSELLTFSDCNSTDNACGFGEFVKPKDMHERNVL